MTSYNADTIQTLEFGRAIRQKLGMYLSADKQEALNLGLRELIYNSQDEFEQGHCSFVEIKINTKEKTITVIDDARGIPVGIRSDGKNSLTAAMLLSHSGAKHEEGIYTGAVGINGLGLKIVTHTSEWLEIKVRRDGIIYFQSFYETDEGALPKNEVTIIGDSKTTGTEIKYKPSKKIYENYWLDYDILKNTLKELSYFTKGLKFLLFIDDEKFEYFSKNGLVDALEKDGRVGTSAIHYSSIIDGVKVELALQWNTKYRKIYSYANNLEVKDGGAFMTGFKTSLTKSFNSLAKENFSGDMIRQYLNGYISVKVKIAQFSNQAKTSLANPEARSATSKAISEALSDFSLRNPHDFEKIIELLNREERAERAADKARQAILNADKLSEDSKKARNILGSKLVDCAIHNENSLLFIVEGNSAIGTVITARDSKYMAGLPIRGKIISALKHKIEDVLENTEVQDIIKALGCGILDKVNTEKLRYGKICIMADADVDGLSIQVLLLTLFYKLMPKLLKEGKIYTTQAPLYKIDKGDKVWYTYTEEEQSKFGKPSGASLTRFKGLGEMTAKDLRNTVFSQENGRLLQMTIEDGVRAAEMFELLMGEDIEPRRNYIFENLDFTKLIE